MKLIFSIFVCVLSAWIPSYAQTPEDVFNHGNELYRSGKYEEAAKEYERIMKKGYVSAELYFNLGNAYYRNERLGKAILCYERAAILHPNDPDIEHNLKLSYLRTVDHLEPVPDLFFVQWMRAVAAAMAPDTARFFFMTSWFMLFGSLILIYLVLRPEALRIVRIVFFASLFLVMLSALMLGIQLFRDTSQDKAIITSQVVTVKSSPDIKSLDAFVVHEGLKVKLSDSVGEWLKITLVDGKVGWIPLNDCERI